MSKMMCDSVLLTVGVLVVTSQRNENLLLLKNQVKVKVFQGSASRGHTQWRLLMRPANSFLLPGWLSFHFWVSFHCHFPESPIHSQDVQFFEIFVFLTSMAILAWSPLYWNHACCPLLWFPHLIPPDSIQITYHARLGPTCSSWVTSLSVALKLFIAVVHFN